MRSAIRIAALVACCVMGWGSVVMAQTPTTSTPATTTPETTAPPETTDPPETTAPPETAPPETAPPETAPPATSARRQEPVIEAQAEEEATTTDVESTSTTEAPTTTAAALDDDELVGGGVIVNGDNDDADEIQNRVKDPAEERLRKITWGLVALAVGIFIATVVFWWRTRPGRRVDGDPWALIEPGQATDEPAGDAAPVDPDATLVDNPVVASTGAAVGAAAPMVATPPVEEQPADATPVARPGPALVNEAAAPSEPDVDSEGEPSTEAPTAPADAAPGDPPDEPIPADAADGEPPDASGAEQVPAPTPDPARASRASNPLFAALDRVPDLERPTRPRTPPPTDQGGS